MAIGMLSNLQAQVQVLVEEKGKESERRAPIDSEDILQLREDHGGKQLSAAQQIPHQPVQRQDESLVVQEAEQREAAVHVLLQQAVAVAEAFRAMAVGKEEECDRLRERAIEREAECVRLRERIARDTASAATAHTKLDAILGHLDRYS